MKFSIFIYCCIFILGLGFVVSCKSDKPNPKTENPTLSSISSSNVIVTNEGNFQFNNASISFLNGQTGQVTRDVFRPTNNRDLGDVAQSATFWNNKLYAVVNNSNKIEVLNATDFQSVGTITGFVSPRYLLPVSNSKAYVSDLYSNKIYVVNLNTNSITKTIPCSGWTEKMLYHLGKIYVTNYWQPYLYVIDPSTDTKTDSILIGKGANSLVADKNDRIVIACGGYKTTQSDTKLVFVNAYDKSVEKTISFANDFPSALAINATKDSLYFLNQNVYKSSIDDNQIGSPFVAKGTRELYGLALDVRTNQLFVSDAVDYVQNGKVYIYSASGKELGKFDVGINPSHFCFY